MIILSDEDLVWPELTTRLNALSSRYGCRFVPLPPVHYGAEDAEVGKILEPDGKYYATFFEAPEEAHLEPVPREPGG